jgi:hypothetical protein
MSEGGIDDASALLLPFYVNGTLGADDRALLDLALAGSPQLRAELAETEHIAALVRAGGPSLVGNAGPHRTRLDELLTAIRAQQLRKVRRTASVLSLGKLRFGIVNPTSQTARWLLPLAASVVVVLAGLATREVLTPPGDTTYRTASGAEPSSAAMGAGLLIVRLKPEARWSDVEALLTAQYLTIVSGPDDGHLTLKLDDPKADAEQARVALAASPLVAFAGLAK